MFWTPRYWNILISLSYIRSFVLRGELKNKILHLFPEVTSVDMECPFFVSLPNRTSVQYFLESLSLIVFISNSSQRPRPNTVTPSMVAIIYIHHIPRSSPLIVPLFSLLPSCSLILFHIFPGIPDRSSRPPIISPNLRLSILDIWCPTWGFDRRRAVSTLVLSVVSGRGGIPMHPRASIWISVRGVSRLWTCIFVVRIVGRCTWRPFSLAWIVIFVLLFGVMWRTAGGPLSLIAIVVIIAASALSVLGTIRSLGLSSFLIKCLASILIPCVVVIHVFLFFWSKILRPVNFFVIEEFDKSIEGGREESTEDWSYPYLFL
jgi:hypothetical protein